MTSGQTTSRRPPIWASVTCRTTTAPGPAGSTSRRWLPSIPRMPVNRKATMRPGSHTSTR